MSNYLPTAPATLIDLHENRRIGKEYETLGRLLTDKRMERPWLQIGKRISTENQYMNLWQEIAYHLHMSRRVKSRESRADRRARFQRIARSVRLLATAIMEGPLDSRIYEYFPADTMEFLGAPNWPSLDPQQRRSFAASLLPEWPALPEILNQLEARAVRLASNALTETRVAERRTRGQVENYFICSLSTFFRENLSGPMDRSLAAIAGVVLEKDIGLEAVKQALRHQK
jgi:hypothetical protein